VNWIELRGTTKTDAGETSVEGKFEVKKTRGMHRMTWIDVLPQWTQTDKYYEVKRLTEDK